MSSNGNLREKPALVREEIKKVIIGKDEVIDAVLMAVLAGGHIMLEDIPGVGKTTLALALSRALSLRYRRMQFTPDVLPGDVTGFSMYNKQTDAFEYREGAVMCNLFLADEINRTSPKTQSALLEVMEEGKVTVDGVTHPLPSPFFVIATQNPLGSAGTQKMPESQLDRFMIRLTMGYPDPASEALMLKYEGRNDMDDVKAVATLDDIIEMQKEVNKIFADDSIFDYIAEIMVKSRNSEWLRTGISPRGAKAILRMARAHAYTEKRDYVVPEDILAILAMTSCHRITLSAKAKAAGRTEKEVVLETAGLVEMPRA
ncbi:MAG: MoxR family ATPase [Clostridia bacterium]|nr:MoxR family ATPase [Clostridia bacterium]